MIMKKCKILAMAAIAILTLTNGLMTYADETKDLGTTEKKSEKHHSKHKDKWLPIEIESDIPVTLTITGEGSKKHPGPLVRTLKAAPGNPIKAKVDLFKDTKKIKIEVKEFKE